MRALGLILFLLHPGLVCAETLLSAQPVAGWSRYGLTLGLVPQGEELQVIGQADQYYRVVHSVQLVDVALQSSYRFNQQATLHLELGSSHHFSKTRVQNSTGSPADAQFDTANASTWWTSGRLTIQQGKRGKVQPQWTFAMGYPWVAKVDAGFSLIGDPIVLTGALRYELLAAEHMQTLSVQCGVGMVANENMSLMLSAQHSVPLHAMHPPRSVLLLGVTYAWGKQGERELRVQNLLESAGGKMHSGLRTTVQLKNQGLM